MTRKRITTTGLLIGAAGVTCLVACGADQPPAPQEAGVTGVPVVTVRCDVIDADADGGKVIGYVIGNNTTSENEARADADRYVSRFAPSGKAEGCTKIEEYRSSGAYGLDGYPR